MNHSKNDTMSMDHDMMNHGGHMMHMGNLKQKFWVSLVLTIPIILMSPMMGMKLPFQFSFTGSNWIVAILATILFFYGGKPFFSGAKGEMQEHKPAMMMLIALGISVSYIYSMYAFIANDILNIQPQKESFFWELSTLIVIMLLGHWVEMNTISHAGSAVDALGKLLPDKAHLVENEKVQDIKSTDIQNKQILQVRAGEKIPADGIIVSGKSTVNEAMVTGEAKQVEKDVKGQVIGGSINGDGTFEFKVTGTGETSYLAQVQKLVSDAQQNKSKIENTADRVAGWLFYAALIIGIIAFITWTSLRGLSVGLSITVTVLIIACPHALGLAVPLVTARSTALAANHGLLIRNRDAMESINKIKYVLMDKTGTLTEGLFKVRHYESYQNNLSDVQVLKLMATLENGSSHPMAVGILNEAKQQKITVSQAKDIEQITGAGLQGTIEGKVYKLVSATYLKEQKITYDADSFKKWASEGNSIAYLVTGEKVIGMVAEGDQIKSSSKKAIQMFKDMNIEPVMITGDNNETAKVVADKLGITTYRSQLHPEDKQRIIGEYQNRGDQVMMVGDGVNDAPSLAKANIGIAIGSGTDVAIESADIILVKSDPMDIVSFIKLAKNTHRKMMENLWWGAGYNLIALPLAAGVLAPIGFMLDPMVGAVIMSLSTIIVAINAMTLKVK
ncbi:Lead, cadmium, zinc and mercury transporting ATPase [Pediococcus damnosus]|uniref:P-type Cu(+) transporter n=1 Tax=Pediococcus damnosus TaxID=51663 RepID=A0A0R2GVA6_9LACO|nr:heavy metal translocating P-type ATPase [Pediococcus damnosus]AMV59876.1 Lead, cadmium, zinc and mercury transporting ATPase [Pediococcus damnosus]AMV61832.1 Lead, cadmium, zinc and mercury transporting ATPase [Pediococcus damnosus]AMV64122.1 Lead, cadmium, zinc and mercury transporting ATPase [Pediococcus damnosus]AMV66295.1 Lead, cadmium, zinc and mercury transporting ATPase [Pediococcus damnosus]AMV68571.1 Lead, cadmium, zinc and mercury transporting ATPase [Pediococcus damnosus]